MLRVPDVGERHPAVVVLHGADGPSAREHAYAEHLCSAGFLTLEPAAEPAELGRRASFAHEMLPLIFSARSFLARRPDVLADQIGLLGFSAGANAALLAATRFVDQQFAADGAFGAFLAFFPPCHLFNRAPGFELSGLVWAPLLIATAALDEFDNDPWAGRTLVQSLPAIDQMKVRTAVFYGAHHDFDMPGPDRRIADADANRGAGGAVTSVYDPDAAERARALAAQFFSEMRTQHPGRR